MARKQVSPPFTIKCVYDDEGYPACYYYERFSDVARPEFYNPGASRVPGPPCV